MNLTSLDLSLHSLPSSFKKIRRTTVLLEHDPFYSIIGQATRINRTKGGFAYELRTPFKRQIQKVKGTHSQGMDTGKASTASAKDSDKRQAARCRATQGDPKFSKTGATWIMVRIFTTLPRLLGRSVYEWVRGIYVRWLADRETKRMLKRWAKDLAEQYSKHDSIEFTTVTREMVLEAKDRFERKGG